jgi:hypothetical protein
LVHVDPEHLLRIDVAVYLESRFFLRVIRDQQQDVTVERSGAHLFGERDFESERSFAGGGDRSYQG